MNINQGFSNYHYRQYDNNIFRTSQINNHVYLVPILYLSYLYELVSLYNHHRDKIHFVSFVKVTNNMIQLCIIIQFYSIYVIKFLSYLIDEFEIKF